MKNNKIIEQPSLPENPYNVDHIRDIGISLLIGIVLSFLYVIVYCSYNESIRNREEIENATDMKVLGVVPIQKSPETTSYFLKNLIKTILNLKVY